jgi:hypothetical protein
VTLISFLLKLRFFKNNILASLGDTSLMLLYFYKKIIKLLFKLRLFLKTALKQLNNN